MEQPHELRPHELRKLIFYSTVGPDRDNNAWQPFTMAKRAIDASLDCEIFLAGLMRKAVREGQEGRQQAALQAVLEAKIPIRFSPG